MRARRAGSDMERAMTKTLMTSVAATLALMMGCATASEDVGSTDEALTGQPLQSIATTTNARVPRGSTCVKLARPDLYNAALRAGRAPTVEESVIDCSCVAKNIDAQADWLDWDQCAIAPDGSKTAVWNGYCAAVGQLGGQTCNVATPDAIAPPPPPTPQPMQSIATTTNARVPGGFACVKLARPDLYNAALREGRAPTAQESVVDCSCVAKNIDAQADWLDWDQCAIAADGSKAAVWNGFCVAFGLLGNQTCNIATPN
jgi:hypothetical protein